MPELKLKPVRALRLPANGDPEVVNLPSFGPQAVQSCLGTNTVMMRRVTLPLSYELGGDRHVVAFHPAFYPNGMLQADDDPITDHRPTLFIVHRAWVPISASETTLARIAAFLVSQEVTHRQIGPAR